MARPKSEDKRNALLAAAVRVIVSHGLGAPTAAIAKEAGVANGSLFTYFETKSELFNQLYLELKNAMATATLKGFPADAGLRDQLAHVWSNWTEWAVGHPDERRALAQLSVCDEITPASHAAGHATLAGIASLLERSRADGPLRNAPLAFVLTLMNSLAEATITFMVQDPAHARKHGKLGFEALWRVLR